MPEAEWGKIDKSLLENPPEESGGALDFYAAGIAATWDEIKDESGVPQWLKTAVEELGVSFSGTTEPWVLDAIKKSLRSIAEGGEGLRLPSWSHSWEEIASIWSGNAGKPLELPISHLLSHLCANVDAITNPIHPKTVLGIIFGAIGAALYQTKKTGKGYRREFADALHLKASAKELLDLFYMLGIGAEMMWAGAKVDLPGTSGLTGGGPDLRIEASDSSWYYFIEANRREPLKLSDEGQVIWSAIDEKSAKFSPDKAVKWAPGIIHVDISVLPRPQSTVSLIESLLQRGRCGERIYPAYQDPEFKDRLKQGTDAFSYAAIRTAQLATKGYGSAGVLIARRQLILVDQTGASHADGGVLFLHKKYESKVPNCMARFVYIVDDSFA